MYRYPVMIPRTLHVHNSAATLEHQQRGVSIIKEFSGRQTMPLPPETGVCTNRTASASCCLRNKSEQLIKSTSEKISDKTENQNPY